MSWHLAASFPVLAVDLAGLPGTFIAFGLGGLLIGFVVGVAVMRLRRTPAVIAAQSQEAARRSLAEQRYAEAEESYRKLFDSSIEGIYVTTPDGRLLNANPALARMMGYNSPQRLIHEVTDIAHTIYVDPAVRTEYQLRMSRVGMVRDFE